MASSKHFLHINHLKCLLYACLVSIIAVKEENGG